MNKYWQVIFLGLIASVLLFSCGNSVPLSPDNTPSIEMTDFKFTPSSFSVYSGREINLKLSNNGEVEHEFILLKKETKAILPFDRDKQADDILFVFKLGAGQKSQNKFMLPDPGNYQIICAIQGHMEAGMVASLQAVKP